MAVTPELSIAILGIIANAAVTWGVMSTKLDWMRRDIEDAKARLNQLERDSKKCIA